MVVFCRSVTIYILNNFKIKEKAEIRKTAYIKVKILLFLAEALSASLFLLIERRLQYVYRPTIAFS